MDQENRATIYWSRSKRTEQQYIGAGEQCNKILEQDGAGEQCNNILEQDRAGEQSKKYFYE